MDLMPFFQSVLEQDTAPIVLCDLNHTILYMNPVAAQRYAKRGGYALVGEESIGLPQCPVRCRHRAGAGLVSRESQKQPGIYLPQ